MHVTEISNPADLAGYRLPWKSLLASTPDASYFQSLDWLESYWRHYGQNQKLRVLVVRSGSDTVGILPLVVRSEPTRLGEARVLTYPLDHWGVFYGPIGRQPAATLTAGLQYIRSRPRDWDLLSLRWVPRDGHDRGRTQRAMRFVGWQPVEEVEQLAPAVDLGGSWDEYWSSRDGRLRSNVARSERRLAEQGRLEYVRYRPSGAAYGDADPRWDLYEACLRVARNTWQAGAATGNTLSHAKVEPFLRDAHAAAAHAGGLDLNLLFVAGRPAAFAYNYHYCGQVSGLRMGYDPAVSRHGSGTVLLKRMLQDSFDRGDRTFDLGPASFDWKKPWQTSVETSCRYTYFAAGAPRAQALRVKTIVKRWLRRELEVAHG
ncbi:MAG TPA: GNAT family N-acetyltransferase [Pirellulales bacterium]|nr:GNAT family N-acetyltransferase [Pirellulales bacterium]